MLPEQMVMFLSKVDMVSISKSSLLHIEVTKGSFTPDCLGDEVLFQCNFRRKLWIKYAQAAGHRRLRLTCFTVSPALHSCKAQAYAGFTLPSIFTKVAFSVTYQKATSFAKAEKMTKVTSGERCQSKTFTHCVKTEWVLCLVRNLTQVGGIYIKKATLCYCSHFSCYRPLQCACVHLPRQEHL